jgi:hypothetical protein
MDMRGALRETPHRAARTTAALLLVAMAVGCGRPATEPASEPEPEPTVQPEPATEPGPATVAVEVFFANQDLGEPCDGEVFPVTRDVVADDPVRGALEALLSGPTAAERAAGYDGWFSAATAGMLLDIEVVGTTAHVTFGDLRPLLPEAWSVCGSVAIRAELDRTLLAFEDVSATRYAMADQTTFYAWLQVIDPDALLPEPSNAGRREGELETGWTLLTPFTWPVQPACCSQQTTGPLSPEGPLTVERWPADGFYDVEVTRRAGALEDLVVTLRRWVACTERPDLACGDLPDGHTEDTRIVGDPASEVVRVVPIEEVGVVVVPIHSPIAEPTDPDPGGPLALRGEPGALATLLAARLDPAYLRWVTRPLLDGQPADAVLDALAEGSDDPAFPFSDNDALGLGIGMPSFRGPFDTSLIAVPGAISAPLDRWPPGHNGLYGWTDVTLEVRDSAPILYLWAGQIAG